MVSTLFQAQPLQAVSSDDPWVYYTDIYQRYQFRYPKRCKISQHYGNVFLKVNPAGNGYTTNGCATASSWVDERFFIYKPQPFNDSINLDEYLKSQDRKLSLPYAINRSPVENLEPGYSGIREISDIADGMICSIIYICYLARIMSIHAITYGSLDLDIKLARSVRLF